MKFSYIIPVFNRPDEVKELLESLCLQTEKNFEVIIVEDGSTRKCDEVCEEFTDQLSINYFYKENEGPGLTRNLGALKATTDYFVFFDSDCIIPEDYTAIITKYLEENPLDCFGGPDAAHPNFTIIQKAISYSMTSFLTTGGIRGGTQKMDKFHPRSFNMGFSRKVFETTGGYSTMRFGEDLDLSLRILEAGFTTGLIQAAFVYHKRRTDFWKFFKQVHNSGIARINLAYRHPGSLKAVHFLPAAFVVFTVFSLLIFLFWQIPFCVLMLYLTAIFIDASIKTKSLEIGLRCADAAIVQHFGYGTGFLIAFWKRIILGQGEFHAYKKNFYK
ncbi:MAG: glycosyltransferase [Bacteroidetes bacterium]|nr:glycosyltransferase [Bacteroidota bacterium]